MVNQSGWEWFSARTLNAASLCVPTCNTAGHTVRYTVGATLSTYEDLRLLSSARNCELCTVQPRSPGGSSERRILPADDYVATDCDRCDASSRLMTTDNLPGPSVPQLLTLISRKSAQPRDAEIRARDFEGHFSPSSAICAAFRTDGLFDSGGLCGATNATRRRLGARALGGIYRREDNPGPVPAPGSSPP